MKQLEIKGDGLSEAGIANSIKQHKYEWLLFLLLVVLSFAVRLYPLMHRPLAGYLQNDDATSHVLVTMLAYDQTPISEHKFLPLFTLHQKNSKFIDDLPTSSVFDHLGNNYYTSFPPLLFIAPYALHKITSVPLSPPFLRSFSLSLHYITIILLLVLLNDIKAYYFKALNMVPILCAAVIYLSAPECLNSYVFSYWGHQLYESIFLLQLILLVRKSLFPLLIVSFIACLTEYAAYLGNFAIAVVLIFNCRFGFEQLGRKAFWYGVAILVATALAPVALVLWFSLNIPIDQYIHALRQRSHTRSQFGLRQIFRWSFWTIRSLGLFALFGLLFAGIMLRKRNTLKTIAPIAVWSILGIAGFRVLENILLLNHSIPYSFDRLKVITLLCIMVLVFVAVMKHSAQRLCYSVIALLAVIHCGYFAWQNVISTDYNTWEYSKSIKLGASVKKHASDSQLVFYNDAVRGAEIWYASRNIIERTPKDFKAIEQEATRRGFDSSIYIEIDQTSELYRVFEINKSGSREISEI